MAARGMSVFVSIGAKLLPSINSAATGVERRFGLMSRRLRITAAETKAAYKQVASAASPLLGLATAGGLMFSAKKAIGDSSELAHELQMLRNAGRTSGQVADAMAAANRTISALPTTTLIDNLKVLNETTGAFGNFQHAVDNLTFNQRFASMMENMLGDKAGDPGTMFNNMVRGLEMRGATLDRGRYQREAAELYKSFIFTGGRVNPEEFLSYSQQANPYTKGMSLRYLSRIAPSLIQEFGGERAGSMQNTWMGTILGKAKNKISTEAWMKLGLLDPSQIVYTKMGPVGWRPGAIKDTNLAMTDPLAWSEKVLIPALKAHGYDTGNQLSLAKALMPLFRDRNANRLANSLTYNQDRTRLHKDEGLINKVPGVDKAYADSLRRDPKMALHSVTSALTNLSSVLFGTGKGDSPVAVALVHVANGINAVAQTLEAHHMLAQGLGGLLLGSAGLAGLRVLGMGLGFVLGPLGLIARILGAVIVPLIPMVLNGLLALVPTVVEGLAAAFALLSNPIGWAVILVGVAAALIYYFRDSLSKAWPKVVAWFKGAWTGLKNWLLSVNWRAIGMAIANALTFGLAGKFADAFANLKKGIPSAAVGMDSRRGGLTGMRAGGGSVRRGGLYMTGERGRELFQPGVSGYVASNRALEAAIAGGRGGGGSPTINIYGAVDPMEVARQVDSVLRRHADNSGLLSD